MWKGIKNIVIRNFRGKFDILAPFTRHPLPRSKYAVMKHALQTRSNFVAISLRLAHEFDVLNTCRLYADTDYNRK